MELKVKYEKGVFKPLQVVKGVKEGEELEVSLEKEDFHALVIAGEAFNFLEDEAEIYSEADLIERF